MTHAVFTITVLTHHYIGLRVNTATSQFEWVNDSPNVWAKWGQGEPSGGGEECAVLIITSSSDFINDVPCSTEYSGSLCQKSETN